MNADPAQEDRPRTWWREPGLWALVLAVLAIYFSRMDALEVRHEEPHRGQVGAEMMQSGDWIVPQEQGYPYLSRPPLHNWSIAAVALARGGGVDTVSVRLPSALAVLATVVLIYAYARRFLGPLGAFAGGAAYASMIQVLSLGRKGETEAFFTFLVAAALLLWHGGAGRRPIRLRTWAIAYFFVGLGTLTKGPQAPVYFGGAVLVYLVVRGRWRELLRPAHFAGLAVFVAVFFAWLVPFWLRMGTEGVRAILFGDVGLRFVDLAPGAARKQWTTYPLKILGSTLPWSVLLFAYLSRTFRRGLGRFSDAALFAGIALAISFPTVWFPPGSRSRYFMPMYPILAVLAGAVVERAALADSGALRGIWTWFQRVMGALIGIVGLAFLGARLFGPEDSQLHQPLAFVLLVAASFVAIAVLLLRASARRGPGPAAASVAGILIAAGLAFGGVVVNAWLMKSVDTEGQVARLRGLLPEGVRLRSIGYVDPIFVHYYGAPVEMILWDHEPLDEPPDTEYFVFDPVFTHTSLDHLRFDWELIEVVTCDFTRHDPPEIPLYIGRVRR